MINKDNIKNAKNFIRELGNPYSVIFLDLDGTIYMGENLIEGAVDFLNRIEKKGIRRFFLSNNSSKEESEVEGDRKVNKWQTYVSIIAVSGFFVWLLITNGNLN